MSDLFSVAMELVAHAQREEQLQIARENLAASNRQEVREIQKLEMAQKAQELYIERNAQYERKLTNEEFLFRNTVVKETYALFTHPDKEYQTMFLHGVGDKDAFAYLCIWVTMNKAKKWISMTDFQIIASKATLFEKHEFVEAYIAGELQKLLNENIQQKLVAASKFEEDAYQKFLEVVFWYDNPDRHVWDNDEQLYQQQLYSYAKHQLSVSLEEKWMDRLYVEVIKDEAKFLSLYGSYYKDNLVKKVIDNLVCLHIVRTERLNSDITKSRLHTFVTTYDKYAKLKFPSNDRVKSYFAPYCLAICKENKVTLLGRTTQEILSNGWCPKANGKNSYDYFLLQMIDWLKIFMPEEIAPWVKILDI